MQKETIDTGAGNGSTDLDEELRDVLITISVIAKRLATKLEQEVLSKEKETDNGKEENRI